MRAHCCPPLCQHGQSLPPTLEELTSLFTALGVTLWGP